MATRRPRVMRRSSASGALTKGLVRQMIRSSVTASEEVKINQSGTSGSTSVAGAIAGITNSITNSTTGIGDRVGLKILVKDLKYRFQTTINPLSTSDRVRLIVFADTQNQNALPSVADVLATASVTSFYNLANEAAGRFRILLDRVIQLNTAGAAGGYISGTIRMGNWPVFYAGGTNYGRNNIFYLEISDTPTNLATFASSFEVHFTDA